MSLPPCTLSTPATLSDRSEADAVMQPHIADAGVRQFLLKNLTRRDDTGFRWRMNLEVLDRDYEQLIAPVGHPGQTLPRTGALRAR